MWSALTSAKIVVRCTGAIGETIATNEKRSHKKTNPRRDDALRFMIDEGCKLTRLVTCSFSFATPKYNTVQYNAVHRYTEIFLTIT